MSDVQKAATDIFNALANQSRTSFAAVVSDIDKHVLPTMAMIAQNLATIGTQLAADRISKTTADLEIQMQKNAAAAVLVGFANTTLKNIEDILNAVLSAVRTAVNTAVGVALL